MGGWSAEDAASLLETALRRIDPKSASSLAMLTVSLAVRTTWSERLQRRPHSRSGRDAYLEA